MAKRKAPENTNNTNNNNNSNNAMGKGKVTPIQVAFIVDRYLADNNLSHTRSAFRSEAASVLHKFPIQQVPKSLLSLGAMLDEYISLKEQKVILDQEKYQLEQEKVQVQSLLQGMQDVMNVYNSGSATATAKGGIAPSPPPSAIVPSSSAGCSLFSDSSSFFFRV